MAAPLSLAQPAPEVAGWPALLPAWMFFAQRTQSDMPKRFMCQIWHDIGNLLRLVQLGLNETDREAKLRVGQLLVWAMASMMLSGGALAAKPKTLKAWERCRDKAAASVNQAEEGVVGVDVAIQERCGEPPAQEPSAQTGSVGMHPYDLVRSKAWKNQFKAIAKDGYRDLVIRLEQASETTLEDGWIVGRGMQPHMGCDEQ